MKAKYILCRDTIFHDYSVVKLIGKKSDYMKLDCFVAFYETRSAAWTAASNNAAYQSEQWKRKSDKFKKKARKYATIRRQRK